MAVQEFALTICKSFDRPDETIILRFRSIPTGNICDAQGRRGSLDYRIRLYFWRTQTGQEVDFLIERGRDLVAMEVK